MSKNFFKQMHIFFAGILNGIRQQHFKSYPVVYLYSNPAKELNQ